VTSSELRLAGLACIAELVPTGKVAALAQTDEAGRNLYRLRLIGLTPLDDVVQFGPDPETALSRFKASVLRRLTSTSPFYEDDDETTNASEAQA